MQVREPLCVLGRNRDGLAEAELKCFVGAGRGLAFRLVRDNHHGLPGFPHEIGERPVRGCHPRPDIHQEEDSVGVADRGFGLHPHARGQGLRFGFFEARRIDNAEREIAEAPLAYATVARNSGRVVDKRIAPADQPVVEGRLAHIGAADDGDERLHRRNIVDDRIKIRFSLSRSGPGIARIAALLRLCR